ncbi:hypothetical protein Tco_0044256 [Tanacetum coccineum]
MTHPSPKRNMVPKTVLMRSDLVSLTTARPVNTTQPTTIMNSARPMTNVFNKAYSTVRRPINKITTTKNCNFNKRLNTVSGKNVNTARPKAVLNAVKGNQVNVVKALACWVCKPKTKVIDYVSKHNRQSTNGFTGYVAFGGTKACDDAGKARMETVPGKEGGDPSNKNDSVNSTNNINTASGRNNTNNVNTVSSTVNTAGIEVNAISSNTRIELLNDPNMHELEDIVYSDDYEDVGAEADMNNLNTFMPISPIPTTRIHKDHPVQ